MNIGFSILNDQAKQKAEWKDIQKTVMLELQQFGFRNTRLEKERGMKCWGISRRHKIYQVKMYGVSQHLSSIF